MTTRALPEGRAVLAVVFTDVVASTELRASIGDRAADDLTHANERTLRTAITDHDGIVVKSLGDGVMALFRACSDALAAAVAAQRAVQRLNRSRTAKVDIRVGVSVGEVDVVHAPTFDAHGTPVVEAARLCAAASGSQILASTMVRVMAGSRSAAVTRPVGALQLKGLPDPVDAEEVDWLESAGEGALPLQPLVEVARGTTVVGQAAERAVLDDAWQAVRSGERRAVLIAGDPGAGKTTLATRWAIGAHAKGAVVLAGRCTEDLGVPYAPFVEAIRHHVASDASGRLADALGHHAATLGRLVPELGVPGASGPAEASPEQEQADVQLAVAAWLRLLAAEQPAVLILDDLHWASASTCTLLRNLLRTAVGERWLIVGTYRATDLDDDHPLLKTLGDLRRATGIERLEMTPLSVADVDELAATLTPGASASAGERPSPIGGDVHARCGGNPFFVTQLLHHLVDEGDLHADRGTLILTRPVERAGVPSSAREVIERRLDRLPPGGRAVLGAAAVVGPVFDVWVLGELVDGDAASTLETLDAAEQLHLVAAESGGTGNRYRFAHALIRDGLYDGLAKGQRARLHHRVGAALARRAGPDGDAAPIATHLLAGAIAGDPLTAAAACVRAGVQAMERVAPIDAITWFAHALRLQDEGAAEDAARCDTLVLLGTAQRHAGSKEARGTLLGASELALRLDDPERLAATVLANFHSDYSVYGRVDHDRVRYLRAALERYPDGDSPTRARLLGVLAVELLFEDAAGERFPLAEESMAMARRVGDPQTLLHVINQYWHAASSIDDAAVWDRLGEEATTLARRIGTPLATVTALGYVRGAAHRHGDLARMRACLDEADELADKVGSYVMSGWPAAVRPMLAIFEGDLVAAEGHVLDVLHQRWVMPNTKLYALTQLTEVRRWQGRFAEVADDTVRAAVGASIRGDVCMAAGRIDEARAAWEEASRLSLDEELRTAPSPAGVLSLRTPLAARFGTVDDVRETLARWDGLGDVFLHPLLPRPIGWHFMAQLRARLDDVEGADDDFERAVARHDELGFPLLAALSRVEWAELLDAQGRRPDDVARLIAEAVEIAESRGAGVIAQRAALIGEEAR